VALARVFVVTSQQAGDLDGDKLRDFYLPFTASARSQYASDPRIASFRNLGDWNVRSSAGSGVHVIYSYDLGQGRQVFDQIVMVGSRRTRVYVLVVRCNQACYDASRSEIESAISSFSVKLP
jgi:hypothetical protein